MLFNHFKITNRQKQIIGLCAIFLFIAILYLFRLGNDGFYNRDEERFALETQEMLGNGNWFIPTLRGKPIFTKPILFHLLILFPSSWFGEVTEFTCELPSVLAGLGGILITFFFGKALWGKRAGLLASLILATTNEYFHQARMAQVDMVLTFFITLTLFSFYLGFQAEASGKRSWYLLGYASMALATLTKGPVGAFLPAMVILIFLLLTKNLARMKEMEWVKGIFIYLLMITPWFYFLSLDDKLGFLSIQKIFYQENLIRYQTLSKDVKPFYYYLPVFMGGLTLWTSMLPAAIRAAFPMGTSQDRERYLFPLIWVIFILVFFSAASYKRQHYLTPLYPAVALLIGRAWDLAISEDSSTPIKSWMRWSVGILSLLMILGAPGYAGYIAFRFPEKINPFFIIYLIFLTTTACAAFLLYRQKPKWSFGLIFLQLYLFYFLLAGGAFPFPTKHPRQSFKVLAQRIQAILRPNEEIIAYKFWKPGMDYYLRRPVSFVRDPSILNQQLSRKERVYCLLNPRSYQEIRPWITAAHGVIGGGNYGEDKMVVISNKTRPLLPP